MTKPRPTPARATWSLQDAKARFSEVVRNARDQGPQHIAVHGRPEVVVLAAKDYARLAPVAEQPKLHQLLSRSPLRRLILKPAKLRARVRDVGL